MKSKEAQVTKIIVSEDEIHGVLSIVNNSSFDAYRVGKDNAKDVVVSKKSPYVDVFSGNGVYLLIEDDIEGKTRFYVGQADSMRKRFSSHCRDKEDKKPNINWTEAILFVCVDRRFPWGKDGRSWFEHRLLRAIIDANRYAYVNDPSQTKAEIMPKGGEQQLQDMKMCVSLLGYPKLFKPIALKPVEEPREESFATVPKLGRRPQFRFSMCGIKPGEKVAFVKDESILAEVVDDQHVRIGNGKPEALTTLAKRLLKKKWGIAGPLQFKYKGEILDDLRKRLEK